MQPLDIDMIDACTTACKPEVQSDTHWELSQPSTEKNPTFYQHQTVKINGDPLTLAAKIKFGYSNNCIVNNFTHSTLQYCVNINTTSLSIQYFLTRYWQITVIHTPQKTDHEDMHIHFKVTYALPYHKPLEHKISYMQRQSSKINLSLQNHKLLEHRNSYKQWQNSKIDLSLQN